MTVVSPSCSWGAQTFWYCVPTFGQSSFPKVVARRWCPRLRHSDVVQFGQSSFSQKCGLDGLIFFLLFVEPDHRRRRVESCWTRHGGNQSSLKRFVSLRCGFIPGCRHLGSVARAFLLLFFIFLPRAMSAFSTRGGGLGLFAWPA